MVKAVAVRNGQTSAVLSVKVTVPKLTVTASSPAGAVPAGSLIALIPSVSGADIYYTTNGTDPNPSDTSGVTQKYSGAVAVSGNVMLKVMAVKPGCKNSDVQTLNYTVSGTAGTLVSVGTAVGGAGDVLSLPLYILTANGGSVTGFQTVLSYDAAAFEFVSVIPAQGLSGLSASGDGGKVTLRYDGGPVSGGEMCMVNLRARSAAANKGYEVAVSSMSVKVDGAPAAAGSVPGKAVLDEAHSSQSGVSAELTNSAGQTVSGSGVKGTVNVSLDMSAGAQESRPSGLGKVVLAVYDQGDRMVSLSMWDVDLSDPDYLLIRTINIPTGVQVKAIRLMVMGGNLQPVMSAKGL